MIGIRRLVVAISLAVLSMPLMYAQDLSNYRGFQLGMNLPAVAKQVGVKPSEAKVIRRSFRNWDGGRRALPTPLLKRTRSERSDLVFTTANSIALSSFMIRTGPKG